MKLSPHFTLEELIATSLPDFQDEPSLENICSLVYLCAVVLEPLRRALGRAVYINSGYRSVALNSAVGGAAVSYHMRGLASDIRCVDERDAACILDTLKRSSARPFVDLAMVERKRGAVWVHVQTTLGTPRGIFLY